MLRGAAGSKVKSRFECVTVAPDGCVCTMMRHASSLSLRYGKTGASAALSCSAAGTRTSCEHALMTHTTDESSPSAPTRRSMGSTRLWECSDAGARDRTVSGATYRCGAAVEMITPGTATGGKKTEEGAG